MAIFDESIKPFVPDYKIVPPALYQWPPKPLAALRWILIDLWFPVFFIFIGLGFLTWHFFTPSVETMATLRPGWIGLIWLRNIVYLLLFAGGLHWWLHIKRAQGSKFKFHKDWLAKDSKKFLWGDQVLDNMFWSLVSGVTFWTFFESLTWWIYASGKQPMLSIEQHPVYFVVMLWSVLFWNTAHFYITHRAIHWGPLYKNVHELHHRNINIGPWSGLAMHPVEHLIYFSPPVLWWFVPVHPVVIMVTILFVGLSPALTHAGFHHLVLKGGKLIYLGDWFHQLHHRYFNVNYGGKIAPLDYVAGSWHDGSRGSSRDK